MSRHRAAARRPPARADRGGEAAGGAARRRRRPYARRRSRVLVAGVLCAGVAAALILVTTSARAPDDAAPVAQPAATSPRPPPTPSGPPTAPVDLDAAVAAGEGAASEAGPPRLDQGIAVFDAATGTTASGTAGDEVFNAASLAKLVVAVDVLDRARAGAVAIDDGDRRVLGSALGPSSDPAMNTLWSGFDGNGGVTRVAARLGMADTTPPDDPSQWGEVQTSARDMVRLMRHIRFEMAAPDRDVLLRALADPPDRSADGFDQRYGLLDGGSAPVKQGWLCCLSNSVDIHTMGIVDDRFVVAVLTNQARGWDRARGTVDAAVRALRGSLADTPTG